MKGIMAWAKGVALTFGGPGLFFVAFLDGSFLSLPEINDLLVVWMVTQHPDRLAYYALMATLGSLAGCMVLYWLAYKGGEAFLRRRMREHHIERGMATFQRHGLLAVFVPAILPPPAPFKIFILLAGVVRVPARKFALAVFLARALRYFGEGLLAYWYGRQAMDYITHNGSRVALATAGVILVAGLLYILWQRRRGSGGAV